MGLMTYGAHNQAKAAKASKTKLGMMSDISTIGSIHAVTPEPITCSLLRRHRNPTPPQPRSFRSQLLNPQLTVLLHPELSVNVYARRVCLGLRIRPWGFCKGGVYMAWGCESAEGVEDEARDDVGHFHHRLHPRGCPQRAF